MSSFYLNCIIILRNANENIIIARLGGDVHNNDAQIH